MVQTMSRARKDAFRVDDARASRSGTTTTPNANRTRPMVTLTLSHEALARLDAIAAERGQSRSGAVEQLIRNARTGRG
jgi:DNA-binding TFAR19-related protein (PDSD5 family)